MGAKIWAHTVGGILLKNNYQSEQFHDVKKNKGVLRNPVIFIITMMMWYVLC